MAKILLVEDDENLREIYQARLMAEGYEIASAKDGEEALVVAKQEKPDLIIADIMMPRISGFEMLDILRNTEGMKHAKVIMLTALGQAEDKARADKLGADRYLVKSQVTLEDIVHAASELLGGENNTPAQTASAVSSQTQAAVPMPTPVSAPLSTPMPQPATAAATPANPAASLPTQSTANPMPASAPAPAPVMPAAAATPISQPPMPQPRSFSQSMSRPMPTPAAPVNSTPGAPPVSTAPSIQPAPAQPQNAAIPNAPDQSKEINNASQLADAVNSLISGTSNKPNVTAHRGSVPSSYNQSSSAATSSTMPQTLIRQPAANPPTANTNPTQVPPVPRAFPTGAPTTVPIEPIKPAPQPEPNITKPEAPTTASGVETAANTPDSIAIKDKKTVAPLKPGNSPVGSDLNDLLQKETASQGGESIANHQPGQIFTPNSNTPSGDPNNIAL
jgi:CheY-like chemotaxis protein